MIRPVNFLFNKETAVNNAFQVKSDDTDVQLKASNEFDAFVAKLRSRKIDVVVFNDTPEPHTPDSIFPNNWVSFHDDGSLVLYPMYAKNRRLERKPFIIDEMKTRFIVSQIIDLSKYEEEEKFLEGTGSIVLDRENRIAYACVSPRTDRELFTDFCSKMNYRPVLFHAVDKKGDAIYHTNVLMCVADKFVVICLKSIGESNELKMVEDAIKNSGKEIIDITYDQMNHFAGNMLQVNNEEGEKFLVMSTQAYESLNAGQVNKLKKYNEIIHSPLNTIETNGGGSARCMMAEIYLKPLSS